MTLAMKDSVKSTVLPAATRSALAQNAM